MGGSNEPADGCDPGRDDPDPHPHGSLPDRRGAGSGRSDARTRAGGCTAVRFGSAALVIRAWAVAIAARTVATSTWTVAIAVRTVATAIATVRAGISTVRTAVVTVCVPTATVHAAVATVCVPPATVHPAAATVRPEVATVRLEAATVRGTLATVRGTIGTVPEAAGASWEGSATVCGSYGFSGRPGGTVRGGAGGAEEPPNRLCPTVCVPRSVGRISRPP